ncbi:MAG: hypothetical protein O2807_05810 [bacterium]|nr:hypothetical protein [bacterium]
MESVSLVVVGALLLLSFAYAAWPLFNVVQGSDGSSAESDVLRESEVARLLSERENAYKQIVEVDLDRQMGKLSDEDYAEMMGAARNRALGILRRLEARGLHEGMVAVQMEGHEAEEAAQRVVEGARADVPVREDSPPSLDEKFEADILRYRKVKPVAKDVSSSEEEPEPARGAFCPSCGGAVIATHKFCSSCGEKLP